MPLILSSGILRLDNITGKKLKQETTAQSFPIKNVIWKGQLVEGARDSGQTLDKWARSYAWPLGHAQAVRGPLEVVVFLLPCHVTASKMQERLVPPSTPQSGGRFRRATHYPVYRLLSLQ